MSSSDSSSTTGVGKAMKAGMVLGVMVSAFALLIWYKLRMVTSIPRTAYADPKQLGADPKTGFPPAQKHEKAREPTESLRAVPDKNTPETSDASD